MMGMDEERGERIPPGLVAEDQALTALLTSTYSRLRPSTLAQLEQLQIFPHPAVLARVDKFCMDEAKDIVGKMVRAATEGGKEVVKKGDVGGVKGRLESDADSRKGFVERLLAMADELAQDPANMVPIAEGEEAEEMKDE